MGTTQSKDQGRPAGRLNNNYKNGCPYLVFPNNYIRCDAPPPPPPPLDPKAPPPPPPPSSESSSSTSSSSPQSNNDESIIPPITVPNPGPYESAIMPCKAITALNTHDGFRMEIQKQLSPFMVVMHNFHLGTSFPDGSNKSYNFLTQVADESGVVMSTFDPFKRDVSGRVIRSVLGGVGTAKLQASVSPDGSNDTLLAELDLGALTWTGNLKYGSMGGGGVFGMNYYQSITDRLAMGGEGMYVAANGNLMNSYTLKYELPAPDGPGEGDDNIQDERSEAIRKAAEGASGNSATTSSGGGNSWFLAQLNPGHGMLNLYYRRIVTPNRVTLASELTVTPTFESQLTFGAEFKLQRSKVGLAVDGTGKIQSVIETKLGMAPGSPTLSLNAEIDHGKDSMKFGYGLNVGA